MNGAIRFANYYNNHMVLQRAPQRANIWGFGTAGVAVNVKIDGLVVSTINVGADGVWKTLLPATTAGGPHNVSVTSSDGGAALSDVMFGDVWVCSGQSNMEFSLYGITNFTAYINAAQSLHNIRLFRTEHKVADVPQLAPHLQRPLGLVETNWGGTPVESWSSPDALAKCPQQKRRAINAYTPSALWNGMVAPLLPMTIYGAIWYQDQDFVSKEVKGKLDAAKRTGSGAIKLSPAEEVLADHLRDVNPRQIDGIPGGVDTHQIVMDGASGSTVEKTNFQKEVL
ncbi:SIAE-like protein [Mya arenaria]|uniref:SIAE-like protein n=1 Tax=Mya arenaria TaxID=6604 RepID=A0ABY7DZ95_MYAAR|nr:SIAE-like protein [Mya arenaria]